MSHYGVSMENYDIIIPDYLEQSDSLGSVQYNNLFSENQQESNSYGDLSGEQNEFNERESDDLSNDYSSVLFDISTGVDSLDSNLVELQTQIDILNDNLVTLQEDNKVTCGLLFCIMFFFLVKFGFSIFNKILGLDSV